ncbi:penicillin-binding protein 2 [Clostridia bacterium]|nr:penicillin-binding protein 2 [Clostridia bacterium]
MKLKVKIILGLCCITAVVAVALAAYGVATHENPLASILPNIKKPAEPEELVSQYFDSVKAEDYGAIYDALTAYSKEKITFDDFLARHKNIYGGIEAANLEIIIGETKKENGSATVSYSARMDTLAGEIAYVNQIAFIQDEESGEYSMQWAPSVIFPSLAWSDKVRVNTLTAKRGTIYDCDGVMLAGEGTASSIGFVPGKMRGGVLRKDTYPEGAPTPSPEELAVGREADIAVIAELLEMSVESVNKKLGASWVKDDSFVPLKTVSKDEEALKEAALQIPGILITDVVVRYYPLGEKASHIIGYIQNINAEELETRRDQGYHMNSVLGKAGLERIYEDSLRAQDGKEIVIVDENGTRKEVLAAVTKNDGSDLRLTIDAEIQCKLYDQFAEDKSCSVAMNPKTGEVLALVSTPTYDTNDFVLGMSMSKWTALSEDENKPMLNRFKAALCPGSTMKAITAAIGLNTGIILPTDDFGHSGKRWQKDGSWGGYSITTLTEYDEPANIENALVYSDNIFFGKAALKIGDDTFASELKRIGFEDRIPFEYALYSSIVSSTEDFASEIQLADSGFGQGQILVNPIHMAAIYASFVNGGDILRPQLMADNFARDVWIENAFSPQTANAIKNDLIQVIERGTGKQARIPGVTLAGKTGTAEIKQSQADKTGTELGWFVMFNADDNSENPLLIVTMVEDVKNRGGSHYVIPKVKILFE